MQHYVASTSSATADADCQCTRLSELLKVLSEIAQFSTFEMGARPSPTAHVLLNGEYCLLPIAITCPASRPPRLAAAWRATSSMGITRIEERQTRSPLHSKCDARCRVLGLSFSAWACAADACAYVACCAWAATEFGVGRHCFVALCRAQFRGRTRHVRERVCLNCDAQSRLRCRLVPRA